MALGGNDAKTSEEFGRDRLELLRLGVQGVNNTEDNLPISVNSLQTRLGVQNAPDTPHTFELGVFVVVKLLLKAPLVETGQDDLDGRETAAVKERLDPVNRGGAQLNSQGNQGLELGISGIEGRKEKRRKEEREKIEGSESPRE